ncbi:MAG: ClpXP protease specificity-enhancing factor [Gammaproteobacteria bacterium]
MAMTSSRPYIIRALYDWILDNECTPYILVNALYSGVEVPQEHVKDGQIILNISPTAIQNLSLGNEAVNFDGRFAGMPKRVFIPISGVMGIYAKENGQGMIFETEGHRPEPTDPSGSGNDQSGGGSAEKKSRRSKPPLRLVK